ncbi:MAG: nuclear transport factor 2 family protein [Alphaproteobacteria bacterium]
MSDEPEAIRALAVRFFDAIQHGDAAAIEAIYDPAVEIWHNTDRATVTREDNLKTLRGFIARAPERRYTDRRLVVFPGGFVQQHLLIARQANGKVLELPACIVCAVSGGRITRLDEYFDSAALAGWLS